MEGGRLGAGRRGAGCLTESADTLECALGLAYRYLNRRERTVAEMRAHLIDRGTDARVAERAIEILVEQGSLDDARFARVFTEDKRALEQWGNERIRRTLTARGIEPDLLEATLASEGRADGTSEGASSELDRALALLRRRFGEPPRDRRGRDRALGVLLRKGYDSELAIEALASYARNAT